MARNRIQFQKGLSEARFAVLYGSEERWREALASWRWPDGFICPKCRYLAEFEWRFNHRFDLAAMIPALGRAAVRTPPATYSYLKWADYGA